MEQGLLKKDGKVVIPNTLTERMIWEIHVQGIHSSLKNEFLRHDKFKYQLPKGTTLRSMVERIRNICMHCQTGRPKLIRRKLGETETGKAPGEVLRSDFLYINEEGYLLVISDTFTRTIRLYHCETCDADEVVKALLDWRSIYGLRKNFKFITDRGSHFANIILQTLMTHLRGQLSYAISYAPWSNGSLEIYNKKMLRLFKTISSELSLPKGNWKVALPEINYVMNVEPLAAHMYSPMDLMFGENAADEFARYQDEGTAVAYEDGSFYVSENTQKIAAYVKEITAELQLKWDDHKRIASDIRMQRRLAWNSKIGNEFQFQKGDWIFVSKENTDRVRNKLRPVWVGP